MTPVSPTVSTVAPLWWSNDVCFLKPRPHLRYAHCSAFHACPPSVLNNPPPSIRPTFRVRSFSQFPRGEFYQALSPSPDGSVEHGFSCGCFFVAIIHSRNPLCVLYGIPHFLFVSRIICLSIQSTDIRKTTTTTIIPFHPTPTH